MRREAYEIERKRKLAQNLRGREKDLFFGISTAIAIA